MTVRVGVQGVGEGVGEGEGEGVGEDGGEGVGGVRVWVWVGRRVRVGGDVDVCIVMATCAINGGEG